jgi:uncharacterized hydrophobic protein (TIGR00271 family)
MQSRLKHIIRIKPEDDAVTIYKEVLDGTFFRGANLWTLVGAMVIACIGLNYNSTMALIGAMIISPLMGPIIGMGFALAVKQRGLMRSALKHWLVAVVFCLAASTIFFLISPFKKPSDQIIAFATPTFFDCLLAFTGGLIGMLAIIRKDGTKVLAGVAVATACLPPLCTVGFGIANWDTGLIIGGLYFYLLNCMYIGLGTLLFTRLLRIKLPKQEHDHLSTTSVTILTVVSVLFLIPGIYIATKLYADNIKEQNIEAYIHNELESAENSVVKIAQYQKDSVNIIDVVLTGVPLADTAVVRLEGKLTDYGLRNTKLNLHYADTRILFDEIKELKKEIEEQNSKIKDLEKSIPEVTDPIEK